MNSHPPPFGDIFGCIYMCIPVQYHVILFMYACMYTHTLTEVPAFLTRDRPQQQFSNL